MSAIIVICCAAMAVMLYLIVVRPILRMLGIVY